MAEQGNSGLLPEVDDRISDCISGTQKDHRP